MTTRWNHVVNGSLLLLVATVALAKFGPVMARHEEPRIAPQQTVENLPVDFSASQKTVVLIVKSNCPFCTASMDFYRRLTDLEQIRSGRVRLVIAGPEPVDVLSRYTSGHGLQSKQIVTAHVRGVAGTPTLLVVSKTGVVEAVWVGKLGPFTEQDVIDAVNTAP